MTSLDTIGADMLDDYVSMADLYGNSLASMGSIKEAKKKWKLGLKALNKFWKNPHFCRTSGPHYKELKSDLEMKARADTKQLKKAFGKTALFLKRGRVRAESAAVIRFRDIVKQWGKVFAKTFHSTSKREITQNLMDIFEIDAVCHMIQNMNKKLRCAHCGVFYKKLLKCGRCGTSYVCIPIFFLQTILI